MTAPRNHTRRSATLAGVVGAVLFTSLAGAPAAQAAPRDGRCDKGEFCLYFNSGLKGSVSDFSGSVRNYGSRQPSCYEFRGPGRGRGRCVKNNAASAWNRTSRSVTVYPRSNFGSGYTITYGFESSGNLPGPLKNENASHRFE